MSISVTCECGHHFETPEAGPRARCPDCGREWTCSSPSRPRRRCSSAERNRRPPAARRSRASRWACLFFFACLSGVPAIFLGRQALGDIKRSGGRLRGRGMAIAGIVLGVIGCLFTRRAPPARGPLGPRGGPPIAVRQQPQADRPRHAQLPRGQRLPAPRRDHRQGRQAAPELAGRHPPLPGMRARSTRNSISTSPGTAPTTSPCSTRCRPSTPAPATAP